MDQTTIIQTLTAALAAIEANPQHWDQTKWHCGTSHCLAGFCDIILDPQLDIRDIGTLEYPNLCSKFADDNPGLQYLFGGGNSLDYIKTEIAHLQRVGEISGYDSEGYGDGDL